MKWILVISALLIIFWSFTRAPKRVITSNNKDGAVIETTTPSPAATGYVEPVAGFKQRATKKLFGTYVTPQHSPVQPERFMGYHTGVDAEYGDVTGTVPVMAIAEGKVIYSKWVSGYGGVIVIQHPEFLGLYGHVVSSVNVGQEVKRGQQIAVLGKAYSVETDGERKHLHLGIIKGNHLNLLGYVQDKSLLSQWIDPMTLF
ncbi:M23 family metallopeptidase [Patescibacteria group bacterium]|nr:M23 family metallopeptidase [Patescibacteria group bacterium]